MNFLGPLFEAVFDRFFRGQDEGANFMALCAAAGAFTLALMLLAAAYGIQ